MTEQRDDAWLKSASPEQIQAALDGGELDDLVTKEVVSIAAPLLIREGQRTEQWLKTATPEQISTAHDAGELNDLLGRK